MLTHHHELHDVSWARPGNAVIELNHRLLQTIDDSLPLTGHTLAAQVLSLRLSLGGLSIVNDRQCIVKNTEDRREIGRYNVEESYLHNEDFVALCLLLGGHAHPAL